MLLVRDVFGGKVIGERQPRLRTGEACSRTQLGSAGQVIGHRLSDRLEREGITRAKSLARQIDEAGDESLQKTAVAEMDDEAKARCARQAKENSAGFAPLKNLLHVRYPGTRLTLRGGYDEAVRRTKGFLLDQKGKEDDQGLIVLATRKPRVSNRTLVWRLTRTAARTERADSLRQEPPRTTGKLGSPPRNHADPSVGAPS